MQKDKREKSQNMDAFIESLPLSRVRFYYYDSHPENGPSLSGYLHLWNINSVNIYVSHGKTSGWSYNYIDKWLRRTLSAPKTDVEAFEKSDYFMVGGDETKMGNHLTVGLILNQQKLVMVAHVNHYTYLHDTANTFFDERIECNTYLQHPLLPSTQCQTAVGPSLYTVKTRFEAIYPVVPAILTRLAQVYVEGPNASQSTGDQLAIGPRGGRYIMKHGRRKYLKGGADPIVYKGTGFSDELMAFLARHIIGPVVAIKDDLEMIRVFYDDFNEVAPMANENIVFQYEFRHGEMQIFYVDALKALQAFYASTAANPTIAERRCLEDITAGRAFQVLVVV